MGIVVFCVFNLIQACLSVITTLGATFFLICFSLSLYVDIYVAINKLIAAKQIEQLGSRITWK